MSTRYTRRVLSCTHRDEALTRTPEDPQDQPRTRGWEPAALVAPTDNRPQRCRRRDGPCSGAQEMLSNRLEPEGEEARHVDNPDVLLVRVCVLQTPRDPFPEDHPRLETRGEGSMTRRAV